MADSEPHSSERWPKSTQLMSAQGRSAALWPVELPSAQGSVHPQGLAEATVGMTFNREAPSLRDTGWQGRPLCTTASALGHT